jgi:hypothetical protein
MDGRGIRQFGYALAPPSSAQTVRVRDGETIVSDGPFADFPLSASGAGSEGHALVSRVSTTAPATGHRYLGSMGTR